MQNTMTPMQAISRASQLFQAGNFQQSEKLCRAILNTDPRFHQAWFQLGLIAVKAGKMDVAANMVSRAANFQPNAMEYQRALGEICRRAGRLDAAVAHGRKAVELMPTDAESHYNLGLALADSGQMEEAAEEYRQALAYNPNSNFAANNLGSVLERSGDEEGALASYLRAVEIEPNHTEALNNLGALYSFRGELDEARAAFMKAIDTDPGFVHAHYNISGLKKYTEDDPHYIALEKALPHASEMPVEMQTKFWFALGKARDDIGRYEAAYDAYKHANELKRSTFLYNRAGLENSVSDIIKRFDKAFAKRMGKTGYSDETPVFILGMPRSGSTLIEQTISSHGDVLGAGELRDFADVLAEARNTTAENSYMDWLLAASDDDLADLGEAYIKRIRKLDAKAIRITDKMPGNFFYAGLIAMALPNAKIIHSMRDPLDSCWSNYTRLFNETMLFAYDLEDLGHYYVQYKRLMDHWHKVLGPGRILDVRYENMVGDFENEARRLIDYCGMDWQDDCLEFYNNKRHVKTASIAQVRKPIYKTSVARWQHFAPHLEGLKKIVKGVGDYEE